MLQTLESLLIYRFHKPLAGMHSLDGYVESIPLPWKELHIRGDANASILPFFSFKISTFSISFLARELIH